MTLKCEEITTMVVNVKLSVKN